MDMTEERLEDREEAVVQRIAAVQLERREEQRLVVRRHRIRSTHRVVAAAEDRMEGSPVRPSRADDGGL